jgi:hypothetical protein
LPSEPLRPPLPRRRNLTRGLGDPAGLRAFVGNGNVTDLREWGSHPLFFLRAGLRDGLFHAGVAIFYCERLRQRRLLWNTMRPFLPEGPLGSAYLRSCRHLAWTDRTRRIGIAQHVGDFPRQPGAKGYASMRNAAEEASAFQSWNRAAERFLALLGEAPIAAGAAP